VRRPKINIETAKILKTRYERGATIHNLARELGVSAPTVSSALKKVGCYVKPRGRREGSIKFSKGSQLLEKLEIFSNMLGGDYPNREVVKCVVDYALKHNDGRTFRKIDRRYSYNGLLSQFRREYLENSYYIMGRLWRAVYQQVLNDSKGLGKIKVSSFSVTEDDLKLCMDLLSPEDKRKILCWLNKHEDYMIFPNEEGVHKIVKDCEKTMKSIVSSKLRFIYKYDPAYEAEDLVNYLRIIAYRVASKYDWEKVDGEFAYLKCINYTKRSLWNAAFLIIKENTGEDYSRLRKVGSDEREYITTTISLDSAGEEDGPSLNETIGGVEDFSFEVFDLMEKLSDPGLNMYLRLEHENVPEFIQFVRKNTGKDENDLYIENYEKWRELAQKFSGIQEKDNLVPSKLEQFRELASV